MKKRLLNKIVKECGTPEHFCFDYIDGASTASDIRRMREYVRNVNRVKREYEKT